MSTGFRPVSGSALPSNPPNVPQPSLASGEITAQLLPEQEVPRMVLQLLLDQVLVPGGTPAPRIHGIDHILSAIPMILEAVNRAQEKTEAQIQALGANTKTGFDATISEQQLLHLRTCEEIKALKAQIVQLETELKAQTELHHLQQQEGFSGFVSKVGRSIQHTQGSQMVTLLLSLGAMVVGVFAVRGINQLRREVADLRQGDEKYGRSRQSNPPSPRPHPERGTFDEQLADRYQH